MDAAASKDGDAPAIDMMRGGREAIEGEQTLLDPWEN